MIKKIEDFTDINGGNTPFMSVIKTEGISSVNESDGVYVQVVDGVNTLAISLMGTSATVCSLETTADMEELCSFLQFRHTESLLSDFLFDGFDLQRKSLMRTDSRGESFGNVKEITPESRLGDYEKVFQSLSDDGDFNVWYPVFSRKVNNSFACGVYAEEDNSCVSCAIAPYVYEKTAVIAGVYTDEAYRGKGYATQCVKTLLSKLKNKGVDATYLWCEERNINFYKNMGFEVCGEVYVKEEK